MISIFNYYDSMYGGLIVAFFYLTAECMTNNVGEKFCKSFLDDLKMFGCAFSTILCWCCIMLAASSASGQVTNQCNVPALPQAQKCGKPVGPCHVVKTHLTCSTFHSLLKPTAQLRQFNAKKFDGKIWVY